LANEFLYTKSEWLIAALLIGLLVLGAEAGFRLGHRNQSHLDNDSRSQLGTIQGAMLGLLGLLLGFTFSMSVSRFDSRKQLVTQEANAIGTCFLRGHLLPKPYPENTDRLFREYVDLRIQSESRYHDEPEPKVTIGRAERLQQELWVQASQAAEQDPRSIATGLFVQSLNEAFDFKEKRRAALNNHVPETVLVLLIAGAFLTVSLVGYGCGGTGRRFTVSQTALSLLMASVIFVIIDIDRPLRGLIRVNQASMLNLKDNIRKQIP
jgi:hypothetical protein